LSHLVEVVHASVVGPAVSTEHPQSEKWPAVEHANGHYVVADFEMGTAWGHGLPKARDYITRLVVSYSPTRLIPVDMALVKDCGGHKGLKRIGSKAGKGCKIVRDLGSTKGLRRRRR
jgi:hypothetical protein